MVSQDEMDRLLMDEIQDLNADETLDAQDEQMATNKEWGEGYGAPEPEQQFNKHAFIHATVHDIKNPEKVTYLDHQELGKPLFNMRFMLDIEDIAGYYLDDLFHKFGVENKISKYFRKKIINVSDSGLSNEGFIQKMNVTTKMDLKRERVRRSNINNLKGGNQVQQQQQQ